MISEKWLLLCGYATFLHLACERQTFLLAHRPLRSLKDGSRGGTSATQRQKFHADEVNQYLHNKSVCHGVPNTNLFNFTFLLVDFGKVLCSFANELQKNSNASSREDYIPANINCFVTDSSRLHLTFVACCLLSGIRKQLLKQ